jgi:hypothetical protein
MLVSTVHSKIQETIVPARFNAIINVPPQPFARVHCTVALPNGHAELLLSVSKWKNSFQNHSLQRTKCVIQMLRNTSLLACTFGPLSLTALSTGPLSDHFSPWRIAAFLRSRCDDYLIPVRPRSLYPFSVTNHNTVRILGRA